MYAIASLLDPISDMQVRALWERFELSCGMTGIRVTPVPHLSWLSAEEYQLEPVEMILHQMAEEMSPFILRTAGLGIFTGRQPVVYIVLVKDERLLKMHKHLWELTLPYASRPNLYYNPDQWIPHITLANYELDPGRLGCAVEQMAFEEVGFEILFQDFTLLFRKEGAAGLHSSFKFQSSIT
jgi:2'-5' RNA ligase